MTFEITITPIDPISKKPMTHSHYPNCKNINDIYDAVDNAVLKTYGYLGYSKSHIARLNNINRGTVFSKIKKDKELSRVFKNQKRKVQSH